jgi:Xaa-Pro dipeptidase
MERLVGLAIGRDGRSEAIAPAFEVSRMLQAGLGAVSGWEEDEDPLELAAQIARQMCGDQAVVALDGRFWFKDYQRFAELLPHYRFVNGWLLVADLRMRKSEEEIKWMSRACQISCDVVEKALANLERNTTERELEGEIARLYRERGVAGGALVQSGENSAIPHGGASERVIQPCDALLIDTACCYEGYHSDLTRTYVVEEASERFREIYGIVQEAQRLGIEKITSGTRCEEADYAARSHIESKGFGKYFTHRLGHGIGLEIHEEPYLVRGNEMPLDFGMAVTVEPGIYIEGEFGVRIEDVVACGQEGPVVLTGALPKELQVVTFR